MDGKPIAAVTPPARYWRSIWASENGTTSPWRTSGPSSSTRTSKPASASTAAVVAPPAPEPTMSDLGLQVRTGHARSSGRPAADVSGHVSQM